MSATETKYVEDKLLDYSLPSQKPFMYIEKEEDFVIYKGMGSPDDVEVEITDNVTLLAFGAYNACGLIGTEMGGIAVVSKEAKCVLATKRVPHSMNKRSIEFKGLLSYLKTLFPAEEGKGLLHSRNCLMTTLRTRGYEVRM